MAQDIDPAIAQAWRNLNNPSFSIGAGRADGDPALLSLGGVADHQHSHSTAHHHSHPDSHLPHASPAEGGTREGDHHHSHSTAHHHSHPDSHLPHARAAHEWPPIPDARLPHPPLAGTTGQSLHHHTGHTAFTAGHEDVGHSGSKGLTDADPFLTHGNHGGVPGKDGPHAGAHAEPATSAHAGTHAEPKASAHAEPNAIASPKSASKARAPHAGTIATSHAGHHGTGKPLASVQEGFDLGNDPFLTHKEFVQRSEPPPSPPPSLPPHSFQPEPAKAHPPRTAGAPARKAPPQRRLPEEEPPPPPAEPVPKRPAPSRPLQGRPLLPQTAPRFPLDQKAKSQNFPRRTKLRRAELLAPILLFAVSAAAFAFLPKVFSAGLPLLLTLAGLGAALRVCAPMDPAEQLGTAYDLLPCLACLLAALTGALTGLYASEAYVAYYYSIALGRKYDNVLASSPGIAYADAGVIQFAQTSKVDTSKSLGHQDWLTYCVAPILDEGEAQSVSVSFWAVGIDCCGYRDAFECGDIDSDSSQGGVRVPPDGLFWGPSRAFVRAINHSAAVYNLQVESEPILLHWVANPTSSRNISELLRAVGVCLLGVFLFGLVVSTAVLVKLRAEKRKEM